MKDNVIDLRKITFSEWMNKNFETRISEEDLKNLFNVYSEMYGFEQMKDDFDKDGLRFSVEFLNQIGTTISIIPVQALSLFCDYVTFHNYADNKQEFENQILSMGMDIGLGKLIEQLNATSLGNMAFIYLNTLNPLVKAKIVSIINLCAKDAAIKMGFFGLFKPDISTKKIDARC